MFSHIPMTTFMLCSTKQDRELETVADRTDQMHQLERLLRIHAGSRLIQQKHLGVGCQSPHDFQATLSAVGQAGGKFVRAAVQD